MSLEFPQNCFLFLSFHLDFSVPIFFITLKFNFIQVWGILMTRNQGQSVDPSLLFSCRPLYHVKSNKPLKITLTWLTQLIGWLYVTTICLCVNEYFYFSFIYSLCIFFYISFHFSFHFCLAFIMAKVSWWVSQWQKVRF